LEVDGCDGCVECPTIQPTSDIFCQIQLTVNAQFVQALVIECNPALASTPLATADKDMLIASLRFPIWPYNSNIIAGDKLQTTTRFVLNKPQLAIRILGEFFLGGLIIEGSLILKPGLILEGSNIGLAVLLLSLGSEMCLASQ
jgi:hypothetical protein